MVVHHCYSCGALLPSRPSWWVYLRELCLSPLSPLNQERRIAVCSDDACRPRPSEMLPLIG